MKKRFICKTLEAEKSKYCQQNQSNSDDQPPDFTICQPAALLRLLLFMQIFRFAGVDFILFLKYFCYSMTRFRTNAPAGTSWLHRNEQSMTA